MDDNAVSNNEDVDKVLTTVAHIVLHFTAKFPEAEVYAEGVTASRNRLYRMSINRQYFVTSRMFKISGITEDNEMETFVKGVNYIAFIVQRKFS